MVSLTTDEALLIYREVMLDLPPTLKSKEAQEMRARLEEERRVAHENGVVLDVPYELGDL